MADDEVEISVGTDSLTVKSGGNAAARITNTIADLLSPFSETTGAIGDVIHYYRQDMALRAIARARDIAKETDANLQPVPPKFLVKWVEDASLEESNNDELVDLWAGLLVSASTQFSPIHFQVRRILSEITLEHINFLKHLCNADFQNAHELDLKADYSKFNEIANQDYTDSIEVDSVEFEALKPLVDPINNSRIKVFSVSCRKSNGLTMIHDLLWETKETKIREFESKFITKYLIEVGIIEEIEISINLSLKPNNQRHFLRLDAYHLTDFGVKLLNACLPKKDISNEDLQRTTP